MRRQPRWGCAGRRWGMVTTIRHTVVRGEGVHPVVVPSSYLSRFAGISMGGRRPSNFLSWISNEREFAPLSSHQHGGRRGGWTGGGGGGGGRGDFWEVGNGGRGWRKGWEGIVRESDGHRWRENAQNRRPPFCHRAAIPHRSRAIFRYTFLSYFRAANKRFLCFSLPISLYFFFVPKRQTRASVRADSNARRRRRDNEPLFPFRKCTELLWQHFPIIQRPHFA